MNVCVFAMIDGVKSLKNKNKNDVWSNTSWMVANGLN